MKKVLLIAPPFYRLMGSIAALAPIAKNKTYTLASRETVSIKELAGLIKNIINNKITIEYDSSREDDQQEDSLALDTTINELHWEPKVGLEEGIKRYAKWYQEQIDS